MLQVKSEWIPFHIKLILMMSFRSENTITLTLRNSNVLKRTSNNNPTRSVNIFFGQ